jgi:hypothetical protein
LAVNYYRARTPCGTLSFGQEKSPGADALIAALLTVVAVAAFILLLIAFPAFRYFVVGAVVLIGVGIWWFIDNQNKEEQRAKKLIPADLVELREVRRNERTVWGVARNNSTQHELTNLTFRIRILDCPKSDTRDQDCEIVGDAKTGYGFPNVPPGQVRSFEVPFSIANVPPARGQYRWAYEIVETRGR